eukprot:jgi/Mesvir1/20657/Mv14874-RA.1
MGKARKGKKAWRKQVDADYERWVDNTTLDVLTGGPVHDVADENLFFEDKKPEEAPPVALKRSERAKLKGPLKHESVLASIGAVKPVHVATPRNPKPLTIQPPRVREAIKETKKAQTEKVKAAALSKARPAKYDLWDPAAPTDAPALPPVLAPPPAARSKKAAEAARRARVRSNAPAVEVCQPGCSYNPEEESHQDALALAVAAEVTKELAKELQPAPVRPQLAAAPLDEEEQFFLEAGGDDGEDDAEEGPSDDEQAKAAKRVDGTQRLTRAQLNRKRRRLEQQQADAAAAHAKKLRADLQRLDKVVEEVATMEATQEERRLRRQLSRQERAAERPRRLGKAKFEPAPLQVLTTDEVTGSLRQVKGCYSLARDRFKSLQRRELIEPVNAAKGGKKPKRRRTVTYIQGSRGEKARETHEQIQAHKAMAKAGSAPELELITD